jgi:hypothetical protein
MAGKNNSMKLAKKLLRDYHPEKIIANNYVRAECYTLLTNLQQNSKKYHVKKKDIKKLQIILQILEEYPRLSPYARITITAARKRKNDIQRSVIEIFRLEDIDISERNAGTGKYSWQSDLIIYPLDIHLTPDLIESFIEWKEIFYSNATSQFGSVQVDLMED